MIQALRSLRLNQYFPPFPPLLDRLPLLPAAAFQNPEAWRALEADRLLAQESIPALLPFAGNPDADSKLARLRQIALLPPLTGFNIKAVEPEKYRYDLILDTVVLEQSPLFERWMIRGQFAGMLEQNTVAEACTRPPVEAWELLSCFGSLEELTRGQLGPKAPFPETLTASLTRLSPLLERSMVDDPLVPVVLPQEGLQIAHSRKWATPGSRLKEVKAWLEEKGSKNLVYGY
jgi:hypothetical protein